MDYFTSIVVDDITEALEMISGDIKKHHPEINIIGKATSVVGAAKLLRKTSPDILFLDINLGDGSGFDLLEIHPNLQAKIIFITASDEHAIKAFKFSAIDYILKPYHINDLSAAIEKAKTQISPLKEQLNILKQVVNSPNKSPEKISLHTSDKIIIVEINQIIHCKSDNNYTTFYLQNAPKIVVSKTLKYYADLLKDVGFIRTHQSHLVNTNYIKEFIKSDGGYLLLKDNSNIPISVRKKHEILAALKKN